MNFNFIAPNLSGNTPEKSEGREDTSAAYHFFFSFGRFDFESS